MFFLLPVLLFRFLPQVLFLTKYGDSVETKQDFRFFKIIKLHTYITYFRNCTVDKTKGHNCYNQNVLTVIIVITTILYYSHFVTTEN